MSMFELAEPTIMYKIISWCFHPLVLQEQLEGDQLVNLPSNEQSTHTWHYIAILVFTAFRQIDFGFYRPATVQSERRSRNWSGWFFHEPCGRTKVRKFCWWWADWRCHSRNMERQKAEIHTVYVFASPPELAVILSRAAVQIENHVSPLAIYVSWSSSCIPVVRTHPGIHIVGISELGSAEIILREHPHTRLI